MSTVENSIAYMPPAAMRAAQQRTLHRTELVDEYAWLKAHNWREALRDPSGLPETIYSHLLAENAYADAVLAPLDSVRDVVLAELRERVEERDAGPPQPFGPFIYKSYYEAGSEHPIIARRLREGGREDVLLDTDALARGRAFFTLGSWRPSPTHDHLAYATDVSAAEFFTIAIRDLRRGTDLDERIPDASGRMVWARDGTALYYVQVDRNHRASAVYRHRLGTRVADDELIFEEPDPAWLVGLSETQSGRFGTINLRRGEESEVYTVDLSDRNARARLIAPRTAGLRYDVDHTGSLLVLRTNADGAEDFKLMVAPVATPDRQSWRDFVPHRPGVTITSHRCFKGGVARLEREGNATRLVVRNVEQGQDHTVAFDDDLYSLTLDPLFEPESHTIRFTFSTPVRPSETYDYVPGHGRSIAWRQRLRKSVDPADYITRSFWASARDGEGIPVSIMHRRDVKLDGSAPCLLYAYGSYGWSVQPSFALDRLPLLERGFIYAIAHVRGGSERGQRWHRAGKLANRSNSFMDFIAVAEALIAAGYTSKGRIVGLGRSAGGMIMGASLNLAPDLFAGVIADVPFVDVLNTALDEELPLTPAEWTEWGDPKRDPAAFATIRAYSPYEQIKAQIYPPILATAGLADPRVTYWEPAKWIARLRHVTTGGGPFLLRTNLSAGHSGRNGRFTRLDDRAREIAFALRCVNHA
jgi:oligopeptidase B